MDSTPSEQSGLIGTIHKVLITDISHEGDGVGRLSLPFSDKPFVVFIPFTAVGDLVRVKITKAKKAMLFGEAAEILSSSPDRVPADCKYFGRCGGCELRHISYERENEIKTAQVISNLSKIGKCGEPNKDYLLDSGIFEDNCLRYRNNVQFPIRKIDGKIGFGFFERGSNRLCEIDDCLLVPLEFIQVAKMFCELLNKLKISVYDDRTSQGLIRHLFIRRAEITDELMVGVVINSDLKRFLEGSQAALKSELVHLFKTSDIKISTAVLNFNTKKSGSVLGNSEEILFGEGFITDKIFENRFRISARSFYQVNHAAMERLYSRAISYMTDGGPSDILLDLYCGIGSIGISAAENFKKVIGVEIVPAAVKNARINAEINKKSECEFYQGDAKSFIKLFESEKLSPPSVIVIDPPRGGAERETLDDIMGLAPARIVYVSCNSATLSRDILILSESYKLEKVSVVNMFPRTRHVETVVLMSRVDK